MSDGSKPGPDLTDDAAVVDADGMGVSSERVGPSGPGQVGRTGLRDTSRDRRGGAQPRPEQSAGGPEVNPDPISLPKAGYPKQHPRSKERPFFRRGS